MCDYVGIKIKTTATESPCSNGTVLTNNQTIENMMIKIISDTQLFLEMVLSWAMKTKNSLQNVACFSPFQFILGKNLKVLLKLSDNLPTLSVKPSSQLMQQFFFFFFPHLGTCKAPSNAEQSLGMELQEKEAQKDQSIHEICLERICS